MNDAFAALARRLGYTFSDSALLTRALTHRSKSGVNNERLEFLGDGILNFVIAAELFERFPNLSEGELTRLRASMVKQQALAKLARKLELGTLLNLGSGEYKSGGHDRDSILSDALEAVIAAIYKDGGIAAALRVINKIYTPLFAEIDPASIAKDPKTRLQEWLQQHGLATPVYNVLSVSGESHNQLFLVECLVPGLSMPVTGAGSSRRNAEQEAASKAFALLGAA